MRILMISCILALFVLPSCRNEPVRVGAPNKTASVTLTTLQTSAAVLDEIRADIKAGTLPATVTPTYNKFAAAYTEAKAAFQAYDKALHTPAYSDKLLTDLKTAMAVLEAASLEFDRLKGK